MGIDPWAWMSNPLVLAWLAHMFAGAFIVLAVSPWINRWCAAVLFLGFWAIPKEFIFDVLRKPLGEGDTWRDSGLDFAGYAVGALVLAQLACYLQKRYGKYGTGF